MLNPPQSGGEPSFYGGYNLDSEIRKASSSGGCFSALAELIIQDKGIVVGAAFFPSGTKHICIENSRNLERLRGSKYVESNVIDIWPEIINHLKSGKKLLFSGTPCQVAAARKILSKWYTRIIFIETICLGTPSPLLFQRYLSWKECKVSAHTIDFRFRYKDQAGNTSKLKHQTTKGTFCYDIKQDPYMQAFYRGISLKPSCYACHFKGFPRTADITLGDFWGVENVFPEYDSNKGISLVICNTQKGHELLSRISLSFILKQTTQALAERENPMLAMSAKEPQERDQFWRDFNVMQTSKLFVKYRLMRTQREKLRDLLHYAASSIWHMIKK